jgi:orotate phosphoribosyltransferase
MSPRMIDLIPSQHGHFRLMSGHHAEFLLDTEPFLESEQGAARISALAERIRPYNPTAVCGPPAGTVDVAQELAKQLGCKDVFALMKPGSWKKGVFTAEWDLPLEVPPGSRVALVDDVITAGAGVRSLYKKFLERDAEVIVVGTLLALSRIGLDFFTPLAVPVEALEIEECGVWLPEECPQCAAGVPIGKGKVDWAIARDLKDEKHTIGRPFVVHPPDRDLLNDIRSAPHKLHDSAEACGQEPKDAYKKDVDGGFAPFCKDDSAIVFVAMVVRGLLLAHPEDDMNMVKPVNYLAARILDDWFPDAEYTNYLPESVESGPLAALAAAAAPVLPNLSAFLASCLLRRCVRECLCILPEQRENTNHLLADFVKDLDDVMPLDAPLPELCGLSLPQFVDLLAGDWVAEGSFRVNRDLPAADLESAGVLHDARLILELLRNSIAIQVVDGELSASAVASIAPRMRLQTETLGQGREYETPSRDFWIWKILHLLVLTGLVSRRNDSFWITPEGRARLDDGQPGALFADLFIALFRESRLKYFDRFEVKETLLWGALPACFYLLGQHANDWRSAGQLAAETWPRAMRKEDGPLPTWNEVGYRLSPFIYVMRVLRPLTAFGLLEWRDTKHSSRLDIEYRATPLFQQFLYFDESGLGTD